VVRGARTALIAGNGAVGSSTGARISAATRRLSIRNRFKDAATRHGRERPQRQYPSKMDWP
jgi:ketopantoate reductase